MFNVSIRDRFAGTDDARRAEAFLDHFAERHNLTEDQTRAIYADSEHPLFNALFSGLQNAVGHTWTDPTYIVGEIVF